MRHHHHPFRWVTAAITCAATIGLLATAASACDVPATTTERCAPDNQHWEGTVTITNNAPTTYTLSKATLDTTAWSPTAKIVDLTTGVVLQPGDQTTMRAVNIPLTTGGALVTYTGRYGTGAEVTYDVTLYRPVERCQEPSTTTTTVAPTPDTTEVSTVPTTPAPPTTQAAPTSEATVPSTPATVSVAPSAAPKVIGWVESTTTTASAEVLGESVENTTAPELAKTGADGNRSVLLGAGLLTLVGVGLVLSVRLSPKGRLQ